MSEEHKETRFIYEMEKDGKRFKNLVVQTPHMHKLYERYHDLIFMDATYKTNKYKMPLVVFSSINNEGKNIVVGFAIVQYESSNTYEWLLKSFKEMNNNVEPGVILTDFDAAMCHGIENSYEHTEHLLCQWHMWQNFKRHFLYLKSKRSSEANQLFKMIVGLIFTEDFQDFEKSLHLIFSSTLISEMKKQYLRKLLQIKSKWAAHAKPPIFTAGTHTTSRVESVNSQIKRRVWSRSTLSDTLDMFLELEDIVKQNILNKEKMINEREEVYHNPLLKNLYEVYSNFAFNKMLYQFSQSHDLYCKLIKSNFGEAKLTKYRVKDCNLRDSCIVSISNDENNHAKYECT